MAALGNCDNTNLMSGLVRVASQLRPPARRCAYRTSLAWILVCRIFVLLGHATSAACDMVANGVWVCAAAAA